VIEILAQICCPEPRPFTAGIVLHNNVVVEAAPIVSYMKRGQWTRDRVRKHCHNRGWTIEVVYKQRRP
jgi:hypothetical protein